MKTILNLFALIIAGGYATAALAETAGARLPAAVNLENAVIVFSAVLAAAILAGDYVKQPATARAATARAERGRVPAATAHQHAYRIRRGFEAARLANPPASVSVFPKSRPVECDRAA